MNRIILEPKTFKTIFDLRKEIKNLEKQYKNQKNVIIDLNSWKFDKNLKSLNFLFAAVDIRVDVSKWDVSNIEEFVAMFLLYDYDVDISLWNMSNAKDLRKMFFKSKFKNTLPFDISSDIIFDDIFSKDMLKNETILNNYNYLKLLKEEG